MACSMGLQTIASSLPSRDRAPRHRVFELSGGGARMSGSFGVLLPNVGSGPGAAGQSKATKPSSDNDDDDGVRCHGMDQLRTEAIVLVTNSLTKLINQPCSVQHSRDAGRTLAV